MIKLKAGKLSSSAFNFELFGTNSPIGMCFSTIGCRPSIISKFDDVSIPVADLTDAYTDVIESYMK